jgi:hypothetical protein
MSRQGSAETAAGRTSCRSRISRHPSVLGVGDPCAEANALVGRDAAIHWLSRKAAYQLRARPSAFPPPLPRTPLASLYFAMPQNHA